MATFFYLSPKAFYSTPYITQMLHYITHIILSHFKIYMLDIETSIFKPSWCIRLTSCGDVAFNVRKSIMVTLLLLLISIRTVVSYFSLQKLFNLQSEKSIFSSSSDNNEKKRKVICLKKLNIVLSYKGNLVLYTFLIWLPTKCWW